MSFSAEKDLNYSNLCDSKERLNKNNNSPGDCKYDDIRKASNNDYGKKQMKKQIK